MYGLKQDWEVEEEARCLVLEDFESLTPRWCPGCGDHAVLGSLQRLARDLQLPPEEMVIVSGIGCSSRFPHYMKTYGFHGLHGRPLPIASGVLSRRPDLNVFVVTGDGDCCAIGTAHWIHAIRHNMNLTVLLFDNNIYGLTKMQSSPTTPLGNPSNTHPGGVPIGPINPLEVTLGIANASFVAQTLDWNPLHLYNTIKQAHEHNGLAFVRILQRCPHFMRDRWNELQDDTSQVVVLEPPDGIQVEDGVRRIFPNIRTHDPADLGGGRHLATGEEGIPMGLLYRNPASPRYNDITEQGLGLTTADKLAGLEAELDRFAL
ncbi:MAG: 2-oxoglutarate oxidoreductase [Gemmatimonadetes bacterium]|nr:2-oxoglutarate oxidoreductase [Gemmatimonadota bacterium]